MPAPHASFFISTKVRGQILPHQLQAAVAQAGVCRYYLIIIKDEDLPRPNTRSLSLTVDQKQNPK
jgi:hypothetical protein